MIEKDFDFKWKALTIHFIRRDKWKPLIIQSSGLFGKLFQFYAINVSYIIYFDKNRFKWFKYSLRRYHYESVTYHCEDGIHSFIERTTLSSFRIYLSLMKGKIKYILIILTGIWKKKNDKYDMNCSSCYFIRVLYWLNLLSFQAKRVKHGNNDKPIVMKRRKGQSVNHFSLNIWRLSMLLGHCSLCVQSDVT